MTRKPNDAPKRRRNKDQTIFIFATAKEKRALQRAALRQRLPLATWLRNLGLAAAEGRIEESKLAS